MGDEQNTNVNTSQQDTGGNSLYGPNTVTGSADDAFKGKDVTITNTNTQTQTVKGEGTGAEPETQKEPLADKNATNSGESNTPESVDVQTQLNNSFKAEEDVTKDLASKGINFDDISKEYEDNGELSEESLKALEKAGYPKSVVDAYIAGLEATVQRYANEVFRLAGGEQEFERMSQFVASMGQGDIDAFNSAIEAGNLKQLEAMFEGYKARMTAKMGTYNRTILGQPSNGVANGGYASKAEMVKAMSDPRYLRDAEYTREVQAKTIASTFIG